MMFFIGGGGFIVALVCVCGRLDNMQYDHSVIHYDNNCTLQEYLG